VTDRSPQNDDVIARMRDLDEALERRGVSNDSTQRVRVALEQRALEHRFAVRLRWWPALAFAAGAIVMAAALLHQRSPAVAPMHASDPASSDTPQLTERRTEHAPNDVEPRPPEFDEHTRACPSPAQGDGQLAAGACVDGDGVRITALTSSHFQWSRDLIVLRSGELMFDVAVRPERPLEVIAGEATIEVVGTSFVVHQDRELGWISLLEGHVRVGVGTRPVEDLREGEQLEWSVPSRPAPPPMRRDDEGLAALLEEVAKLRRSGEYEAAVERLRAGDRSDWSPRSRQLVSYEIGTLLERQLGDLEAACRHWALHRERYPNGRYESIVVRSMTRMHCEDE
jgi:hypothetical protein